MPLYENYINIPKDLINNCISFVASNICNEKQVVKTVVPKMDFSLITDRINSSLWVKAAAVSGAAAVVLGAYGAHGAQLSMEKRSIYETASKYHFYHSLGLMAVPFLRRQNLVGTFFLLGIMIFSGTCYYYALTDNKTVIRMTPVGGFMFILGWLSILF